MLSFSRYSTTPKSTTVANSKSIAKTITYHDALYFVYQKCCNSPPSEIISERSQDPGSRGWNLIKGTQANPHHLSTVCS